MNTTTTAAPKRPLGFWIIGLFALWVASGVIGTVISGIGFMGVMALIVASVVGVAVLATRRRLAR